MCLNPGPDKVYEVPGFALTGARRPSRMLHCVGGKGVNFARVLARLGHDVVILGISAGHGGRFMEDSLDAEGLAFRMVHAPGESRLATTIMDPATGVHTEVNEAGPAVGEAVIAEVLDVFRELLPGVDYCAIGGSAPPDAPDGVYATMIEGCHEAGVPVMLDTNRNWLTGAVHARPTVLKPNQAELGTILGRQVGTLAEAVAAGRALVDRGIGTVLVTLGEEGAVAITADECLHGKLDEPVRALSPVGSGDATAAGYVAGVLEGRDLQGRIGLAIACGTANALVFGPGMFGRAEAEAWLDRVVIRQLGMETSP